jgi:hypothetical protein
MKRSIGTMALMPPAVITLTSTVAAACAGDTAVMLPSLAPANLGATMPPKATAVARVKPLPEIVTDVPPAVGPDPGLIHVTLGAGRYVN